MHLVFLLVSVSVLQSHPELVQQAIQANRCTSVLEKPGKRIQPPLALPPAPPPVLSFRYFEDKKHHRFDNLDVMLDDAGH